MTEQKIRTLIREFEIMTTYRVNDAMVELFVKACAQVIKPIIYYGKLKDREWCRACENCLENQLAHECLSEDEFERDLMTMRRPDVAVVLLQPLTCCC